MKFLSPLEMPRKYVISRNNRAFPNSDPTAAPKPCLELKNLVLVIAVTFLVQSLAFAQTRTREVGPEGHYKQGIALFEKQKSDAAILEFKAAIALKPDYADAHNALGLALAQKGEMNLAAASFRKAIELDKGSYKAHCNLGTALQQLGDLDGALAAFKQAV